MPRTRWGGEDAPDDARAARERLVDAAERCFERFGVPKTTVEDIATEAKVSRATVYRYFEGGREELILAVLLREAGRFLDRLRQRLVAQATFADAIVEGVMVTIREVRRNPHLALLFAPDAAGLTGTIAGASQALFAVSTRFQRPFLEAARARGELRPEVSIEDAVEWILRTIFSLLIVEGPRKRTTRQQREFLHTFLVPALVVQPASATQ